MNSLQIQRCGGPRGVGRGAGGSEGSGEKWGD